MVRLYYTDITALEDDAVFTALFPLLSAERQERIARCHRRRDQALGLGAGLLLAHGLMQCGVDEQCRRVAIREGGKPYLPDAPEVCFSLSHAGTVAVAAIGEHELGCDVEPITAWRPAVARRAFHPAEYALLQNETDPRKRDELFFRLWTLKESYIKATGEGLRRALDSFCILPGESATADGYRLAEYGIEGYRIACCTAGDEPPAAPIYVDLLTQK